MDAQLTAARSCDREIIRHFLLGHFDVEQGVELHAIQFALVFDQISSPFGASAIE